MNVRAQRQLHNSSVTKALRSSKQYRLFTVDPGARRQRKDDTPAVCGGLDLTFCQGGPENCPPPPLPRVGQGQAQGEEWGERGLSWERFQQKKILTSLFETVMRARAKQRTFYNTNSERASVSRSWGKLGVCSARLGKGRRGGGKLRRWETPLHTVHRAVHSASPTDSLERCTCAYRCRKRDPKSSFPPPPATLDDFSAKAEHCLRQEPGVDREFSSGICRQTHIQDIGQPISGGRSYAARQSNRRFRSNAGKAGVYNGLRITRRTEPHSDCVHAVRVEWSGVEISGRVFTFGSREPMRVKRGEYGAALESERGENGRSRENPPTSIVRYDSHTDWRPECITTAFQCVRGAAVAERLDCSPPTKANRVQSPPPGPGHSHIFTSGDRAGRCRWLAGFLGDLPLPPTLHSGAVPFSPRFTLIASQDLVAATHHGSMRRGLSRRSRLTTIQRDRQSSVRLSRDLRPIARELYFYPSEYLPLANLTDGQMDEPPPSDDIPYDYEMRRKAGCFWGVTRGTWRYIGGSWQEVLPSLSPGALARRRVEIVGRLGRPVEPAQPPACDVTAQDDDMCCGRGIRSHTSLSERCPSGVLVVWGASEQRGWQKTSLCVGQP
ncbi:hypothetical protein PR048_030452 [Dryococelus australis]|uniref:Uncharacterized protein n=1 Tax=Dryococelus australis TaxID=614101 RepID=A0ABQ9G918_9NEOP|nr:hypothetical protein PR048_030452 [Dryococelus australis]